VRVAALSTVVASGTNPWNGEGEDEENGRLADRELKGLTRMNDIYQQAASEVGEHVQRREERY